MAQTFNTELKSVAANYLDAIEARLTKTTLRREIEEHPSYPTLR